MKAELQVVYTREQIAAAVERIADEIRATLGESEPVSVLVLLKGALWFAADLLRHLPENYVLETVRVSSYGAGMVSSGKLLYKTPLPDCAARNVLLVDDVLDSGVTLQSVAETLREQGAARVLTAVAVDKRGCRKVPFEADFAALSAAPDFLVGYGMDYAEKYRNLPYIAKLILR